MKLAVFCGSNSGRTEVYRQAATALGQALARAQIEVVFGGTSKGLMKVLADAVLQTGGSAHGVIPQTLVERGQQYPGLSSAEIVETRSSRKLRMAALADGFVALPGGVGTLEELFEMWVDAQFDGHRKPIALYNVNRYFDHLLSFIDTMVDELFLPPQHRQMIIVDQDPDMLISALKAFAPITASKWLSDPS